MDSKKTTYEPLEDLVKKLYDQQRNKNKKISRFEFVLRQVLDKDSIKNHRNG